MEPFKKLSKLCNDLPYSKCDILNNDIIDETIIQLNKIFSEYNYSDVLGVLSGIWPNIKAIPFFGKLLPEICKKKNGIPEEVVIATYYHRCYNGGVERVQAQLMNIWNKMGYHVVLLTDEPANELDYPYPSSVKRIVLSGVSSIQERLDNIQKICIEENVDVFVNHDWARKEVLWECVLLKMLSVPYIQYVHGHFAWSIGYNKETLFQPEMFKLCDLVLSLSETNARFYQLCGCNSFFVQNPIPEDLLNNTTVSSLNSKHILMIGRLSEEKQPMDCLRTFNIICKKIPDAILDIVGGDDADFISQITTFINKNSLQNNVVIHGKKNLDEITDFYKQSACVIFTSRMEGYPMVILETKAYGLPLVMYELPYLALIKDGKGILTVKQGDIDALATNMIELLENDRYRIITGKRARESFEEIKEYDIIKAWKNIVSISIIGKLDNRDNAFFDPKMVSLAERYIEPMLLDSIKVGYNNLLERSFEYRVGYKILKVPRIIKAFIKNLTTK